MMGHQTHFGSVTFDEPTGYTPYGKQPEPYSTMVRASGKFVDEHVPYRADDISTPMEEVKTGTTILAMTFDGGVVMGADSRTSTGRYVANRASRKISKVHDRIYVCRSGSAADTQALTGIVKNVIGQQALEIGSLPKVGMAANLFRKMCYQYKDNLLAGVIIGGYDPQGGGQVYQVTLGGTLMKDDYAVSGSGSTYILGLIDSLYKPGMSKDECRELVKKFIAHAMKRDCSSGGCIRTTTISKDGVEIDFTPGDQLPVDPL